MNPWTWEQANRAKQQGVQGPLPQRPLQQSARPNPLQKNITVPPPPTDPREHLRPSLHTGSGGDPRTQSGGGGGGFAPRGGGGGGGASSGPTPEQRRAADNLGHISGWNAGSTTNQHGQQMGNLKMSNEQNRALADVQRHQAARQGTAERFARNRNMQTMAQGLTSQMGNAMQGSGLFGFMDMLRGRTDLDNNAVWQQLTQNYNNIENAFTEAYNANRLAMNDASINAEFALRGIEADHAAQLNNIHPDLFVRPGQGAATHGSAGFFEQHRQPANLAQLAGYIMPNNASQGAANVQAPNQLGAPGSFAALMNQYNQRSR